MASGLTFTITAPSDVTGRAAQRQRHAIRRTVQTVQRLVDLFDPHTLEALSSEIESALNMPSLPAAGSTGVDALTGGRNYSEYERRRLELSARLRTFERRRELLADAYTAGEVAKLLHTTRQTPHDRLRRSALLAVLDRGALRFPAWQFDADAPDGVLPGLTTVLRALKVSPLAKSSWFVRPNPSLEGRTPVKALHDGDAERVLHAAEVVGAH